MLSLCSAALSPSELGALTQSPAEKKVGVSGKEEEEEEEGREKTMEEEGEREGEGEGEGEESEREEEDPLGQSAEDEVGKMLRSTLNDLETALEVSTNQLFCKLFFKNSLRIIIVFSIQSVIIRGSVV